MENVNTRGIYFNETDIRKIVETYLDWAEIAEGQTFCATNVMSESTPIGTSIIVGVDGIKCDAGSNELKLVLSAGIYELAVKTTHDNEEMNILFDKTMPVSGTYGCMVDGALDILTDEEKEFKHFVDEALGDREDEYAEMFRRDNMRNIGGRGLVLLEKVRAEIKKDDVLSANSVTPVQLAAVFIEKTESYIDACNEVDTLTVKHDELLKQYRETFEENSKPTKKLARDIEVINRKIDANRQVGDFCLSIINAAVLPVLNAEVEC